MIWELLINMQSKFFGKSDSSKYRSNIASTSCQKKWISVFWFLFSLIGYWLDDQGSFPDGAGIYLFDTKFRPALWPNQSLVRSPEVKRPGQKLTTHLHPVQKLRMSGTIPPLPHSLHGVVLENRDYSALTFLSFVFFLNMCGIENYHKLNYSLYFNYFQIYCL
jgi:hypothetical protein